MTNILALDKSGIYDMTNQQPHQALSVKKSQPQRCRAWVILPHWQIQVWWTCSSRTIPEKTEDTRAELSS